VRRHWKVLVLAGIVATVVTLYVTGVLPRLPDPKQAIEDVASTLGGLTYVFVAVLAFLETGAFVGLIVPGETTVIVGGVIAGQGEIDLLPLIGIVWASCVLGDTASFFIGRKLGRGFVLKHGEKVKIDERRLEKVESYFERHGGKTILIGRFIGLMRALAPFVAGSSGFPYRRFLPFSVIGCGLWVVLFSVLGVVFYRSFDQVAAVAGQATLALGIVVAVVVGGVLAYRRLRDPGQRRRLAGWLERQGDRRALRPIVARLAPIERRVLRPAYAYAAPRARSLLHRLAPGRFAIELMTAAAVATVGLYVFVLYAVTLQGGRATPPADRELLDVAGSLRTDAAVDVVSVVTDLGSFVMVATLVFATGVLLMVQRRLIDLAALIAGSLALYLAVRLAKEGVDRPRPSRPLTDAGGSSFPSGHAAYSTLWVGVALVLTRLVRGMGREVALVGVALAVAVVVGLSRIYLRVHYWSDVAGGWALGAAILGAGAAAALTVERIRHNEVEPPAAERAKPT